MSDEYVDGPLDTVPLKVEVPPYTHYRVTRYPVMYTGDAMEVLDIFAHDVGPLAEGDSASLAFVEYYPVTTPAGEPALSLRFVRFVREWYDVQVVPTPVTVN